MSIVFNRQERLMAPADQYATAASFALAQMRGRQVRLNTMTARGADALLLASIGSPIVRASLPKHLAQATAEDLYNDSVVMGASVAFNMLQKAIDPSARQHGPDGFRLLPCDASG